MELKQGEEELKGELSLDFIFNVVCKCNTYYIVNKKKNHK
jgi:hypothetical protein